MERQRATGGSWLSPSTIWVPGCNSLSHLTRHHSWFWKMFLCYLLDPILCPGSLFAETLSSHWFTPLRCSISFFWSPGEGDSCLYLPTLLLNVYFGSHTFILFSECSRLAASCVFCRCNLSCLSVISLGLFCLSSFCSLLSLFPVSSFSLVVLFLALDVIWCLWPWLSVHS